MHSLRNLHGEKRAPTPQTRTLRGIAAHADAFLKNLTARALVDFTPFNNVAWEIMGISAASAPLNPRTGIEPQITRILLNMNELGKNKFHPFGEHKAVFKF